MNVFVTSDQHYNHHNIIQYCNRPFNDVNEMNNVLISNFNSVVKPNDITFHLGDFSFQNPIQFLKKLNGKHYLIIGNHDAKQHHGFEWAKDTYLLKNVVPNFHIFMSHYAHRVWPHSHHGCGHVFGHSHGKLEPQGRSFDVGVDTNNFFPYNIEDVVFKMSEMNPSFIVGKDPLNE